MDLPPGIIVDASKSPFMVMEDEVGIFVLADRVRHYCANISDAKLVADSFKSNETKEK